MLKRLDNVCILVQNIQASCVLASLLPESCQCLLSVVSGLQVRSTGDQLSLLDEITCHLLRDHPVVALDRRLRQVVRVQTDKTTATAEAVSSHRPSADLDASCCQFGRETLEPGGERVHVCQRREVSPVLDVRSRAVVDLPHALAAVVQGKGRSEEREEADLDGGIVEDGRLGGIWLALGLELASDGAVADGHGCAAGENEAGSHDDSLTSLESGRISRLVVEEELSVRT